MKTYSCPQIQIDLFENIASLGPKTLYEKIHAPSIRRLIYIEMG